MLEAPNILLDSFRRGTFASSWRFSGYIRTIIAESTDEIIKALYEVEQAAADGLYAVGYVAYEAASALNPDLPSVAPADGVPLVWFALFQTRNLSANSSDRYVTKPDLCFESAKNIYEYDLDIKRIKNYIANGDCYQINHTFQLNGYFRGSFEDLYASIARAQQASFSAYIETDRFTIMSASPELFFSLKDGILTTRPMKGTAQRGRWSDEDLTAKGQLQNSPKEGAENLMIVDLLRNDLGIVAETGSVNVDSLFEIETYPTVHQMTSTISAKLKKDTKLTEIFKAMFPCGSVTGAPKKRSMEIIAEIENAPRGVYCGAIGYVAPGGEALFSVAIRTLFFDKINSNMDSNISLGVGSGITWDSEAVSEYNECLNKGAFVHQQVCDFKLIESFRLENGVYYLFDRHIARLVASAEYFGFTYDTEKICSTLMEYVDQAQSLCKVRLLLAADGSFDISSDQLSDSKEALSVAICEHRVNSNDPLCYHKTTCREKFDCARTAHPDCDELIFLNENGQLTEGSYHNLVLKLNGELVTPPLACGLLPGVLREELLAEGTVTERILSPEELNRADEIWLINSVRGWRRASII